ncbi:unnamed protein product [Bursaphelenchus okinawaensis]|uniref:Uncharacterized protein n=1 Tax=Bursaphelenchus okinawaensis TaxID=465554 RepID=A0A811L9V0_9BILA|nr:unnamed protein product [Bursaphelenchus okinawaensis]CAG9119890.1 unnamed protein product [Bursaphelenchus okinawaensis]
MESSTRGKDAGNLSEEVKLRKAEEKEILDRLSGLENLYTTIEELRRQIEYIGKKRNYIFRCTISASCFIWSLIWLHSIFNW